nr:hypothetical protein [Kiloniella majae]
MPSYYTITPYEFLKAYLSVPYSGLIFFKGPYDQAFIPLTQKELTHLDNDQWANDTSSVFRKRICGMEFARMLGRILIITWLAAAKANSLPASLNYI